MGTLLFQGEEIFWKSVGALREAGKASVLSLTQDTVNDSGSVPILTREPEIRETKHIRMSISKGIKVITEDDRSTLQAWQELVFPDRQKCVISHSNTKKVEAPYQSEGGIEVMMLFIGTRLSNLYTAVDTPA
jgi:hypothetical protein